MTKDEKQIIKLEKVDDKTAYENLLVKYAELESKIADIKANCDLAIEGRDIKIKELEQKLEQTEKDLADYQFNYPKIKELEKENAELKKANKKLFGRFYKKGVKDYCELEKENAELKGSLELYENGCCRAVLV